MRMVPLFVCATWHASRWRHLHTIPESSINGENAAVLGIYMLPGANAMEVAENVKKAMNEISNNFPDGLSYEIPFDMTTYISESIHEVYLF